MLCTVHFEHYRNLNLCTHVIRYNKFTLYVHLIIIHVHVQYKGEVVYTDLVLKIHCAGDPVASANRTMPVRHCWQ